MKMFIVFAAVIAVALAFPSEVTVDHAETEVKPDGYKFSFGTSDGTSRKEEGEVTDVTKPETGSLTVRGESTWTDPEGVEHFLRFTADKDGYHPEGSDIPK